MNPALLEYKKLKEKAKTQNLSAEEQRKLLTLESKLHRLNVDELPFREFIKQELKKLQS